MPNFEIAFVDSFGTPLADGVVVSAATNAGVIEVSTIGVAPADVAQGTAYFQLLTPATAYTFSFTAGVGGGVVDIPRTITLPNAPEVIVGPPGINGTDGLNGTNGHGSTTITQTLVIPSVGNAVVAHVADVVAFVPHGFVVLADGTNTFTGQITAVGASTLTVQTNNIITGSAGNTLANGAAVSFAGPQGPQGTQGIQGTTGTNGHGSTTTTSTFTVPVTATSVVVAVVDSTAFPVFAYTMITDGTHAFVGQVTVNSVGSITVRNIIIVAGSAGATMASGAVVTFSGPYILSGGAGGGGGLFTVNSTGPSAFFDMDNTNFSGNGTVTLDGGDFGSSGTGSTATVHILGLSTVTATGTSNILLDGPSTLILDNASVVAAKNVSNFNIGITPVDTCVVSVDHGSSVTVGSDVALAGACNMNLQDAATLIVNHASTVTLDTSSNINQEGNTAVSIDASTLHFTTGTWSLPGVASTASLTISAAGALTLNDQVQVTQAGGALAISGTSLTLDGTNAVLDGGLQNAKILINVPSGAVVGYFTFAQGAGHTMNFTDATYRDGSGGVITSWLWDFGDANTSTAQNPSHTYAAGGHYKVKLTVSDGTHSSDCSITINVA